VRGASPDPFAMGIVGFIALLVNVSVALMLYRYRAGDANMRSVWICSRNDAINNVLVIAAGLAVLWSGSGLPDLLVAFVMAALGISGGWQIVRQSVLEIRDNRASAI
jgi:Co/Zn/Cd efflux system component